MLTIEAVAKRLGCSTNHARRLVRSGAIVPVSIGLPNARRQTIRVEESELIRYVESRTVRPTPRPTRRRRKSPAVREYF